MRILLAKIAADDLELDQADVISAFLNGKIDTLVFLIQAEGFTVTGMFCLVHKSIYGLCQAARVWYMVLDDALLEIGFIRCRGDLACWAHPDGRCVIAHVDDILNGGNRRQVEAHLATKFKIKDLGAANVFVGLRISRDRAQRTIYIDQAHYAKEILETYGMWNCNPVWIPMSPGDILEKEGDLLSPSEKRTYQAMVGALGYLMNCTRPDIAFVMSRVAQFASCPTTKHLTAVKHIFRYIKGTIETKLRIRGGSENPLVTAYFDPSFADDRDDSRSTYGYAILYGGSTMVWKSKKHKAVNLSTTDAEYLAATEVTRDILWVETLFEGLGLKMKKPVELFGDNENANNLGNGTSMNNRTRHIAIRERFVTEKAATGDIKITWIPTADEAADIFTKPLPRDTFLKHAKTLGLVFETHTCLFCFSTHKSGNALHLHLRTRHGTLIAGMVSRSIYISTSISPTCPWKESISTTTSIPTMTEDLNCLQIFLLLFLYQL